MINEKAFVTLMAMLVLIWVVLEWFMGVLGLGKLMMEGSDCWIGQLVKGCT